MVMQRGMLALSQEQISTLLDFLNTHPLDPIFNQRLQLAQQVPTETTDIETDEETIDKLLDLLPPPQESPTLAALRQSLQQFLLQLRLPHQA